MRFLGQRDSSTVRVGPEPNESSDSISSTGRPRPSWSGRITFSSRFSRLSGHFSVYKMASLGKSTTSAGHTNGTHSDDGIPVRTPADLHVRSEGDVARVIATLTALWVARAAEEALANSKPVPTVRELLENGSPPTTEPEPVHEDPCTPGDQSAPTGRKRRVSRRWWGGADSASRTGSHDNPRSRRPSGVRRYGSGESSPDGMTKTCDEHEKPNVRRHRLSWSKSRDEQDFPAESHSHSKVISDRSRRPSWVRFQADDEMPAKSDGEPTQPSGQRAGAVRSHETPSGQVTEPAAADHSNAEQTPSRSRRPSRIRFTDEENGGAPVDTPPPGEGTSERMRRPSWLQFRPNSGGCRTRVAPDPKVEVHRCCSTNVRPSNTVIP